MGWKTTRELVPEAGETAVEEDTIYFAVSASRVVAADGEAVNHVRWHGTQLIVDDKDKAIGWSSPFLATADRNQLDVDDGWKIVQVHHDRSRWLLPPDLHDDPSFDTFDTPLGRALLFWVVPV